MDRSFFLDDTSVYGNSRYTATDFMTISFVGLTAAAVVKAEGAAFSNG